jgi:hypothetical protein
MSIKDVGKKKIYFKLQVDLQMEDNFSISKIQNETNMQIEEENVNC